jgi:hypothetical protein
VLGDHAEDADLAGVALDLDRVHQRGEEDEANGRGARVVVRTSNSPEAEPRNVFVANVFAPKWPAAGSGFSIDNGSSYNDFSANEYEGAWTPAYGTGKNFANGWEGNRTAPTLGASWVDFGSGLSAVGYRRSKHDRAQIKGTMKSGVVGAGNVVWTLPVGYQPNMVQLFPVLTSADGVTNTVGRLVIQPNGQVVLEAGGKAYALIACEFTTSGYTF